MLNFDGQNVLSLSNPIEYYIERNQDGEKIVLGEGQFGIVYKGFCRASPVAIKGKFILSEFS